MNFLEYILREYPISYYTIYEFDWMYELNTFLTPKNKSTNYSNINIKLFFYIKNNSIICITILVGEEYIKHILENFNIIGVEINKQYYNNNSPNKLNSFLFTKSNYTDTKYFDFIIKFLLDPHSNILEIHRDIEYWTRKISNLGFSYINIDNHNIKLSKDIIYYIDIDEGFSISIKLKEFISAIIVRETSYNLYYSIVEKTLYLKTSEGIMIDLSKEPDYLIKEYINEEGSI